MVVEGLYTIGVVSQMTNLSERQIRYYEKQGLLRPARTPGGRRLFSKKDVSDLMRIKHLLAMGYSLSEIKTRWGVDRQKTQATVESPLAVRSLYPLRERPRIIEAVDLMRDLGEDRGNSEPERDLELTKKNGESTKRER